MSVLSLFVYGTLMSNIPQSKGFFPSNTRFIPATCSGILLNLGAYPGLVSGAGTVYGEIVVVEDPENKILSALDHYEDYFPSDLSNSMYHRRKVSARSIENLQSYLVWTYFFNGSIEQYPIITSGRWTVK